MDTLPLRAVDIARLQLAVLRSLELLAELGDTAEQAIAPRGAVSRVSRLAAYGADMPVLAEAVKDLRDHATRLSFRLDAIHASAHTRRDALNAALATTELRLARANGWGLAGPCPARIAAKTPAAQAEVSRVAAGSAAVTASLTTPTCGLGRRPVGGGIG
ncbi:hypothetical protein [Pseudoxanthomonas winnipegensis]|uniref:hypothetical protein n=1 Tax=Pseudoxanthomonas winnipegensis TaxID=2480810 RepID=UPI00103E9993|nr:hypothetical protein [Pseudoxanthomonas winnipegensis]TBV76839.1 hypothetical protein EYC45_01355 [Pseudoxanthomonas winnipegensis]